MKIMLYLILAGLMCETAVAKDDQLEIRIDGSGTYPVVELENTIYKAVIRTNSGAACGVEHAIRDWIIKSAAEDQVINYIDACAQRGPMLRAEIVHDGEEYKTVRAEYQDCSLDSGDNSAVIEYTIYPDSPVIRVDYLEYPAPWANTVDLGTPGGTYDGDYKFHGEETYARELRDVVTYPKSYWNTHDSGDYKNDPVDGGSLNYNGYLIMAVGSTINGRGFGRIMPIYEQNEQGGIRILKLLHNRGFETFPRTGQSYAPPFTGYLFVFEKGLDDAVAMGRKIIDGDMLSEPGFISPWWALDLETSTVENSEIKFRYGRVHTSFLFSGYSTFINKRAGADHAVIFDAIGTGYAQYDATHATIINSTERNGVLELQVKTGRTEKIDRIFRDLPVVEIEYTKMDALWIEDKMTVRGPTDRVAFVMHGMEDIVGITEGKRLWTESEDACGHNFGDCFIRANGSTVEACTYNDHFIYGMVNLDTGTGVGFVYPTAMTIHDWKVWWDQMNLISIEFFPQGRIGKRWIYAVSGGKEELLKIGKSIVDGSYLNVNETSEVQAAGVDVPREFVLESVTPNPFNGQAMIRYHIQNRERTRLEVFNKLGQRVDVLVDGMQEAGAYQFAFRGENLSSGLYFCRLQVGTNSQVKKMILLK